MQTTGPVGTFVACTNAGTATATIGVQMFGPAGGVVGATASTIAVAPNASVIFGSSSANGISVDGNLATGIFSKGSARVCASTSKGILCDAFLAEQSGTAPLVTMNLPVFKKTSQKGA
jgi:hypothetical protein